MLCKCTLPWQQQRIGSDSKAVVKGGEGDGWVSTELKQGSWAVNAVDCDPSEERHFLLNGTAGKDGDLLEKETLISKNYHVRFTRE